MNFLQWAPETFKMLTGGGTALESTIILNWSRNHQLVKASVRGNLSSVQSPINNSAAPSDAGLAALRTHSSSAQGGLLCYITDVSDSGSSTAVFFQNPQSLISGKREDWCRLSPSNSVSQPGAGAC